MTTVVQHRRVIDDIDTERADVIDSLAGWLHAMTRGQLRDAEEFRHNANRSFECWQRLKVKEDAMLDSMTNGTSLLP